MCKARTSKTFSTLYTSIPLSRHEDKLKELAQIYFVEKNGQRRYKYFVLRRVSPIKLFLLDGCCSRFLCYGLRVVILTNAIMCWVIFLNICFTDDNRYVPYVLTMFPSFFLKISPTHVDWLPAFIATLQVPKVE